VIEEELVDQLHSMSDEHVCNLGTILELKGEIHSPESICESIRWLYHSKTRELVKGGYKSAKYGVMGILGKPTSSVKQDEPPPVPSYKQLLKGFAKELGVFDDADDIGATEKHVAYKVIAESLQKLSPSERVKFFEEEVDLSGVVEADLVKSKARAPLTAISALGLANASGFGIYYASTTALGFLTHAAGITLPFATYTGLTSTIAFIIGPPGFLAAGAFLAWRSTESNWRKLAPVIVYLIRQRHEFATTPIV
jgi:uncharacterized protein YaaW (UPF0174 family)